MVSQSAHAEVASGTADGPTSHDSILAAGLGVAHQPAEAGASGDARGAANSGASQQAQDLLCCQNAGHCLTAVAIARQSKNKDHRQAFVIHRDLLAAKNM